MRPGGWAFQYANAHYPDLDDTAVVVMAMDRAAMAAGGSHTATPSRAAREWVEGLQSKNGGWGAFDADNTYYYLNNIPFADHGALLDPPTEDVTARCVSDAGATRRDERNERSWQRGDRLPARTQQPKDGSWFGRWGVNYIYGTWSALCALERVRPSTRRSAMQARRRLADRDPECRRRLGRELRQLQARLHGL